MSKVKSICIYPIIFLLIVICLLFFMVCSSKIPKEKIRKNVIESASYLDEHPLFYEMIEGHNETKLDHYADAITLNITYNLDSKNSFKSVLEAEYYGNNHKSEIKNLLNTSKNNYKANNQYIRYWHGTTGLLRIILLFFNIQQIYILNAGVLIGLSGLLIYKLIKNKLYLLIPSFIIAFICTNSFVVPFSLEYFNMYFISLLGTILLIHFLEKDNKKAIPILFFILGIFTCFIDFLTTETISLTMPLIILLVYKYKDSKKIDVKKTLILIFKLIFIWIIGYVLMWITKWGISAIYLNVNIKDVVVDNAIKRISRSNIIEINFGKPLSKFVILRNVFCLFPLSFFNNQGLILFIFIFILFTFLFFVRKQSNNTLSWMLFLIAIIPYVRFYLINSHSYIHYFFTYRAQISTIIALITGSYYMIDRKLLRGKKCKK